MVTEIEGGLRITLERKIDESYNIVIGTGLFPRIAQDLQKSRLGSKYAIITDSNVEPLYAGELSEELDSAGLEHKIFAFKAGEKRKNRTISDAIIDSMHAEKYGRDTCIIALGGGVVGDLAGYIAATFNRGVPFVQVPTTTISQADSSVGGKVGVDTPHGKNLVGAFKQPAIVYIDVSTLNTLPEDHFVSGLAESVKHGVIADGRYFEWLDQNAEKILQRNPDSLIYLAHQNCRIKGNVVEQDPDEKGLRRILNYGHTIGHALEKVSGYKMLHGHAVSRGMMVAAWIATEVNYFDVEDAMLQQNLLEKFGLPLAIPHDLPAAEIIDATRVDKKAATGQARYCLPEWIGCMSDFGGEYACPVSDEVVRKEIINCTGSQRS